MSSPSTLTTSSPRTPPVRKSFFQWVPTDDDQLQAAERVLLDPLFKLGFEQYTNCGMNSISLRVRVGEEGSPCSSLDVETRDKKTEQSVASEEVEASPKKISTNSKNKKKVILNHCVWIHGFGGGVGTWLPNFKPLAEEFNKRNQLETDALQEEQQQQQSSSSPRNLWLLHAMDNCGFARSKRETNFEFQDTQHVLDYYLACFEEWFEMNDFKNGNRWIVVGGEQDEYEVVEAKITIVAHSFGGFLAGHFTVKNSHRFPITNLFLVDSWGVGIYDEKNPAHTLDSIEWKRRFLIKSIVACTDGLLSPVLRLLEPYAPGVFEKVRPDFAKRYSDCGLEDPKAIFDYIFHCNAKSECVGDKAFRKCVQGRNFAVIPLMNVIPSKLDLNVRLSMVYGEKTWMRRTEGEEMFKQRSAQLAEKSSISSSSSLGKMDLISNAGHQVCSDNPKEFNEFLLKEVLRF